MEVAMALTLKNGRYVPGATTIVGQLDKPFLVAWANNLGLSGIDYEEFVDKKAKLGTLIHNIIQSHLMHTEIEIPQEISDDELALAEQAFYRYLEWENNHTISDVEIEKGLVSETYKYGGYLDIYCMVDGKWTIIDIKTSNEITVEQQIQVSSYEHLVRENNLPVDQLLIINTGKDTASQLQVMQIALDRASKYFKLFKALVDVYYIRKEVEKKDDTANV